MADSFSEFNNSDPVSVNNAFIQKYISSSAIYGTVSIVPRIDWGGVDTAEEKHACILRYYLTKAVLSTYTPSLSSVRIQIGVFMKIIPVAQILHGRGVMALKTALCESKCEYDAFNGENND